MAVGGVQQLLVLGRGEADRPDPLPTALTGELPDLALGHRLRAFGAVQFRDVEGGGVLVQERGTGGADALADGGSGRLVGALLGAGGGEDVELQSVELVRVEDARVPGLPARRALAPGFLRHPRGGGPQTRAKCRRLGTTGSARSRVTEGAMPQAGQPTGLGDLLGEGGVAVVGMVLVGHGVLRIFCRDRRWRACRWDG